MEKSNIKLAGVAIVIVAICLAASFCWYGSPDDNPVARSDVEAGDWMEYSIVDHYDEGYGRADIRIVSAVNVVDGYVDLLFSDEHHCGHRAYPVGDGGIVVSEDRIIEVIGTETISTFRGEIDVRVCSVDASIDRTVTSWTSWIGPGNIEYKRITTNVNGLETEHVLLGSSLFNDNDREPDVSMGFRDRGLEVGDTVIAYRFIDDYDAEGDLVDSTGGIMQYAITGIEGDTLTVKVLAMGVTSTTTMTADEFVGLYRYVDSPGSEYLGKTVMITTFGERVCDAYRQMDPSSDTYVYSYYDAESGVKLGESQSGFIWDGDIYREVSTYHLISDLVTYH